jgi:hypothetical protein
LKLAKREAMLWSCAGLQTMAGRVQVRWESGNAIGQLACFMEFLTLTGLWSLAGGLPAVLRQSQCAEQSQCVGYLDTPPPEHPHLQNNVNSIG